MSNYNYNNPNSVDRQNYVDNVYPSVATQNLIHGEFDRRPDLAYELWLRSMMPQLSNTNERALRAAQSNIYNAFEADRSANKDKYTNPLRWADYLRTFNVNKELARLAPEARYENPNRFIAPARVVSF